MDRILYFEPFNGASGDMIVGALLDLGMPLDHLRRELSKLGLDDQFTVGASPLHRQGLKATDFSVICRESDPSTSGPQLPTSGLSRGHGHGEDSGSEARHFTQIRDLIQQSQLDAPVKESAVAIFRRLGEAESSVHGCSLEEVHFHEVGAVDAIVDIVAACVGFHYFEIDAYYTGPLAWGGGRVDCAHGQWPVPAPATLELIRERPSCPGPVESELLTPTGAAIITTVAPSGSVPSFKPSRSGLGAGKKVFDAIPNLLRITLGESVVSGPPRDVGVAPLETVVVLEATVDNMDGELLGHFMERALSEGALDVYYSTLLMKKNRPGVLMTLICREEHEGHLTRLVFDETTTLGLRRSTRQRYVTEREIRHVETAFGTVRVKVGKVGGRVVNVWPEYEDLRELSAARGVPMKVLRLAVARELESYE